MSKKKEPHNVDTGSPILRGSVPFVAIKEIGELGNKGRKVCSIGYSGRFTANPEHPLASLVSSIISELLPFVHWESEAHMRDDIARFHKMALSIKPKGKR